MRHGLLGRTIALLLSWVFTASTVWASAPPVVAATGAGGDRPSSHHEDERRRHDGDDSRNGGERRDRDRHDQDQDRTDRDEEDHEDGDDDAVRPLLECVLDNGGGRYTAYFGYRNENQHAVTIPAGSKNEFRPAPESRGQPTRFQPGRTPYYPNAPFSVGFDGRNLVWTLTGPDGEARSASASSGSKKCSTLPPSACEVSFFGPQKYARTSGPPDVYEATVTVPAWVKPPHTMHVKNGEEDGSHRVSSAKIEVNGVQVAGPSDFNQNVAGFDRTVTLTPTSALKVTIASGPGSYLTITFCGAKGDKTPPQVTWTEPPPGGTTDDATPRLRVGYRDPVGGGEPGASGVDTSTLEVWLDDVDRTGLFTRRSDEATAELPADLALAESLHRLKATVKDRAGNLGEGRSSFTVDLTPPRVQVTAPAAGAFLTTRTPQIRVHYEDNLGLDLGTLQVLVNGVDRTARFSKGPSEAVATPDATWPMAEGPNQVVARIRDLGGNEGSAASAFNVDTTPPRLTIGQPAYGAHLGTGDVEVIVRYADDQGLDLASFQATVDGAPAALDTGPEGAMGVLHLADGPHAVAASIKDRAGNLTAAGVSFLVDTAAPAIRVVVPLPDSAIATATPLVRIEYADADGLDLATLHVATRRGEDLTALFLPPGQTGAEATLVVPLPEGANTIRAEIRDLAGNLGSASSTFVVDTVKPTASLRSPPPLTNDPRAAIVFDFADDGGSGVDPTSVELYVDDVKREAAVGPSSASWTPDPALADGPHVARLRLADRAGNEREAAGSFVVDTAAPAAHFERPANDSFINDKTPTLELVYDDGSGAVAGVDPARVRVFLRAGPDSNPEAEITSYFGIGETRATGEVPDATPLADGTYHLRAVVGDRAGNLGSALSAFELDTVPPTFTVNAPVGSLATTTPTFDIQYQDDRSGVDVGKLVVNVDGTDLAELFTKTDTHATGAIPTDHALGQGPHLLEVTVFDRAGNASLPRPMTFTVDTIPPIVSAERPADGSYVGASQPGLRFTYADPNGSGIDRDSVRVEVDGADVTGAFTPGPDAVEGPAPAPLPDGPHMALARARDQAGNEGSALTRFFVDTQPPALSQISLIDGSYVAHVDPSGTLEITGTIQDLDPAVSLQCRSGTTTVAAQVQAGQFTCSVPLSEGANQVDFIGSDRTGHQTIETRRVTLDTRPPRVTIVEPANEDYTNAHHLTVSGTVEDETPTTVKVEGVEAQVVGSAYTALNVPVGDTPRVVLRATATDAAGNQGSAAVTLNVDRDPPIVHITKPQGGDYLPDTQVDVEGTVVDASPVVVYVNDQLASLSGAVFKARIPALSGTLEILARAMDKAGNVGIDQVAVQIDTAPPLIHIQAPPEDKITNANSILLAGTATDASPFTLKLGVTVVPVAPDGSFAVDAPLPAEGRQALAFNAVDRAGNASTAEVHVIVDRTPPDLQVVSPDEGAVLVSRPVVVQGLVNDATETTVTVDGRPADRPGIGWQASFSDLPEGPHTFVVVATDAAGNQTTRLRSIVLDLGTPQVTILSPDPATLTRAAAITVTGTVTGVGQFSVAVRGVAAEVTGSSFTARDVPLDEGDNTLVAVATSIPAGRTGQASVLVTRDSTPPTVSLQTPDTISPRRPGKAVAFAADNLALAQVSIKIGGVVARTFTPPGPYEADLVADDASIGQTLVVTAEATDRAGNMATSVPRGVLVVADGGVIVGRVLSDATGLPIEGATVTQLTGSGAGVSTASDERGRYSFPATDTASLFAAQKEGLTRVEREVSVETGVGTVAVDARLTPRPPPVTVGPDGGTLTAGPVTVTVPMGALGADADFTLTPLSAQGLPGLLPLGWSPLAAFELATPGATAVGIAKPLTATVTGLPALTLHLATYNTSAHAWFMVTPGLTPSAGSLESSLPERGTYALLAADGGDPPVTPPGPGEALPGVAMVPLPDTVSTKSTVEPPTIPPTGGTAAGSLAVFSSTPLPSGTVVQAEVTETFTLASGEVASEEKRLQDIVLFRQPTPAEAALAATIPITPSRTFQAVDLVEGKVHLDILAGREAVRGETGGSAPLQLHSGDARLTVPAHALAADTAIDFQASALSSFLPASGGLAPVAEVVVDFSGRTLGLAAELSVGAGTATLADTLLVARVQRIGGVPRLEVVALAELVGDRVVSRPYPGLPGIVQGGRYVLYRSATPVGFVGGTTSSSAGVVKALLSTADLPFVAFSDLNGHYLLPAAPPHATVSASVPGTSLVGSGSVDVAAGATAPLDLTLAGAVTTATVSPADGATAVDPSAQVEIATSAALNPATVTGDNVKLFKGTSSVGVRLVLSGSGKLLAMVPQAALDYSTTYTVQASGLADVFGGLVSVPTSSFRTRDNTPPVYDTSKLTFSLPDEKGNVTVEAPPKTLAPGSTILIIDTGNGVVLTLTADYEGKVAPTEMPATIDDQMVVTITDPLGNVTSFKRSQFVDPATGRTAVGPGGGTVEGPGGVELRIPEGALDKGVVLQIESFGPDEFTDRPAPVLNEAGQNVTHFGSGVRIKAESMPTFKKEVKLAFPVPAGAPSDPEKVFYLVYRRLSGPNDAVAFQTIDHAFVEGTGDAARVVTASYPFGGYVDSIGGFYFSPAGSFLMYTALETRAFILWLTDETKPGRPLPGVITGKVLRAKFVENAPGSSGAPQYEPVAGALVVGATASGRPLLVGGTDDPTVAVSQADGTYTLWDVKYTGGFVHVAAILPDADPTVECPAVPGAGDLVRCATAFEANPVDFKSTNLRFYRNIATANITFPAQAPPKPAPEIGIQVMQLVDGKRQIVPSGVVVAGTPLLIGFIATNGGVVQAPTIQGQTYGVRPDPLKDQPLGTDVLLDPDFTPAQPGAYTIEATALSPFGKPATASVTFRAIAPGGSNNESLSNQPPAVISEETYPRDGATGVLSTVLPRLVFTEPVRNVVGKVQLIDLSNNQEVDLALSGVGPLPDGSLAAYEEITSPDTVVTSLTLLPRRALKFGTRYQIFVMGGASGVEDIDTDPFGVPAPKKLPRNYESEFTTFGPTSLIPEGTGDQTASPGIVVLGSRAFIVQNNFFNGTLKAFDVSNPIFPLPITLDGETYVTWRPLDIAGEGDTVVVATGPTSHSNPGNLYVFDVSAPGQSHWVGAASLTNSAVDGYIVRITMKDDFVYSATARKGIQVVDVAAARDNFSQATAGGPHSVGYWNMVRQLNTDGQGFGSGAVTVTIPVNTELGQPARLVDLKVGDYAIDGINQPLVVATGDVALVVANPQSGEILAQGRLQSGDGTSLDYGLAVALGRVADTDIAVVVGAGATSTGPAALLAVVDLTDPRAPRAVAFLPLPESPVDVVLKPGLALVSAARRTYVVGLNDPLQPYLGGAPIASLGGRLFSAPGSDLVFSTARAVFGGTDALGGVRVAALSPENGLFCPLLTLRTPRVLMELVQDPLNGTLCGDEGHVIFGLCQAAFVTMNIDGKPVTAAIDGVPRELTEVQLDAGPHLISLPPGILGGPVITQKPFTLRAREVADPSVVKEEPGEIESDVKNRSVLPVGHTFVKGVDVFDGHAVRQVTDLSVPGRHLGLEVTRTYSSAAKGADGTMGAGWSFNYDSTLTPTTCGLWVVTTADGSSQTFFSPDNGLTFRPQKGYHTTLRFNSSDGTYDFIDKSGTRHHFKDPVDSSRPKGSLRLDYIEEPHGDRIVPTYDAQGRLVQVAEVQKERNPGRYLKLTYVGAGGFDRIQSVEAVGLGIKVEYSYDNQWGNLVTVKRAGTNLAGQPGALPRIERYQYSSGDLRDRHQMLAATDPNGSRTEYKYYAAGDPFPGESTDPRKPGLLIVGKEEYVKEVKEFPGASPEVSTKFKYDYTEALSLRFKTTVTDTRSNDTLYTMNGNGSPLQVDEPLDDGSTRTTKMEWATDDIFKLKETDANERVTLYGYDDGRGNLTSETVKTADFGDVVTTYAYDPQFNKLVHKKDAEGRETVYALTSQGDLKSVTDPAGNLTRYEYDAAGHGLLTSVTDPRGHVTRYEGHDTFGNPTAVFDPLNNKTTRGYDARGRLISESDTMGHAKTIQYDGLDRPVKETRSAGQSPPELPASPDAVTKTEYYPGGQVKSVTNPNQSTTTFTLDGMNRVIGSLTTVNGGPYETKTEYDGNGNKTQETDRRGVVRKFTYDKVNRLTRVEILGESKPGGPFGQVAAFSYDKVGNKLSETDVMGQTTSFTYDGLYHLASKVLPESGASGAYTERYTYDRVGNRLSLTDANGFTTSFGYDKLNRLIRTENPLGHVTTVTYDDPDGTQSHVNKSEDHDQVHGLRITYKYDQLNRETERHVLLEGAGSSGEDYPTLNEYDDSAAGHGTTVTDPRGTRTRTRLDGLDRPIERVVDVGGLALRTLTSYDGLGNRKALRDPNGNQTEWLYDELGRMVRMTDALSRTATYGYDGDGLKTFETDRRSVTRTYTYDSLGRPRRTAVLPTISGKPWSHEIQYDDPGRKRYETDARGTVTAFELDRMGRVVKETDVDNNSVVTTWDGVNKRSQSDKRNNVTRFEYDKTNRLTLVQDPAPFQTQTLATTYEDAANQRIEKDRRGFLKRTQIDPLGRVLKVTRAYDPKTASGIDLETNTYDGNNNKVSQADAEGKTTAFVYDRANRLLQRTDGAGTPVAGTTSYEYDGNGNQTKEIDPRSTVDEPSLRRGFDALNRVVSETNGEGQETKYGYDQEGNRTSVTEPKGQVTSFAYEELAKLTKVTQPGGLETRYAYDENRNRVEQKDANDNVVSMGYDFLNRLKSMNQDAATGGFNLITLHDYDEDGNETLRTDPKGQTITNTYDELGRLKTKAFTFAPGDGERPWRYTASIAYQYDENNNLKQVDEDVASGADPPLPSTTLTTVRVYDALDRLVSDQTPLPNGGSRTVTYDYYKNGTRKTVTDPAGIVTAYTYDGKNRLATATTASGTPSAATTTYGYYPDDLLKEVTYPNGVKASHGYDKADRLLSLDNQKGATTISAYAYTYDPNGNRLSQVETNGGDPETTTYIPDDLNRLASVTYPSDASFPQSRVVAYGYDNVGNRMSEVTTEPGTGNILDSKTGQFDAVNRLRLLTDSDPAKTTSFDYDRNGNQIAKTVGGLTTAYRYDVRDKLVEADQGAFTLGRFQYDFDGRRNKKIGAEDQRQYVYDDASTFLEYDGAGAQVAKYEWGSDRLISLFRIGEPGQSQAVRRFFSFDALGSVTNLTDDNGVSVASYHIDAWGNFRFPQELNASRNRFVFTSHLYDEETSLFLARARYYDPVVGRFITADDFLGDIDSPPSLHRYLYGNDNPTTFVDPTGTTAEGAQLQGTLRETRQYFIERAAQEQENGALGKVKAVGWGLLAGGTGLVNFAVGVIDEAGTAAIAVAGDPKDPTGVQAREELRQQVKDLKGAYYAIKEEGVWNALGRLAKNAGATIVAAAKGDTRAIAEVTAATTEIVGPGGLLKATKLPGAVLRGVRSIAREAEGAFAALRRGADDLFRGGARDIEEGASRSGGYRIGEVMPDGRIAGEGPGAALANGPEFTTPGTVARPSLGDRIVAEANRVAAPGGEITERQALALRQNLPVVQRRGAAANRVARDEFVRDRTRLIQQWERNTGKVWPEGATPHHIIPLESGGANKWYNLMPTYGELPTHSLPGVPGPHSAGSVLRESIQRSRKALPPGVITDLRQP